MEVYQPGLNDFCIFQAALIPNVPRQSHKNRVLGMRTPKRPRNDKVSPGFIFQRLSRSENHARFWGNVWRRAPQQQYLHSHEVGERLQGVVQVRQCVDDWHVRLRLELLHVGVVVHAGEQEAVETGQDLEKPCTRPRGKGCEEGSCCLLPLSEHTNGSCVIWTGYIALGNGKYHHERPQK